MCVHGVGDHHTSLDWTADWRQAIEAAVAQWDPGLTVQCDFLLYDDLFSSAPLDAGFILK